MPTLSEEDETVLAVAIILYYENSKFDQDEQLKHNTIIQKCMQIIANRPPKGVATGSPQRVPAPSTSFDITAPETICNSQIIHQRHTRCNPPMPSIIEEVVNVRGVQFDLPPHQVDENSNEWQRSCLERISEIEANKIATTNSQQKSNSQVIPNDKSQTSVRHASKKTIQRLIDEINGDNFMSSRNSNAGKLPI